MIASILCIAAGCSQTENTSSVDEEPSQSETQPVTSTDLIPQQPITDENGTLTAVATAGGYEIKLSDLAHQTGSDNDPVVYYTSVIDSDALMAIYEALGRTPTDGDRVAVKLHTGEGDGSYNLDPQFIKALVQSVDGTIVECNTAYGGNRASTALHMQVAEDHGYTAIADVDIMDADGGMEIPVTGGTHLKTDLVGSHLANYDFCMVLSHFKGHAMGGFGGALKTSPSELPPLPENP